MIGSLRWRLQIWHTLVLSAVVLIFASVVYQLLWQTRLQQIDTELGRTAVILSTRLRLLFPPPNFARRSDRQEPATDTQRRSTTTTPNNTSLNPRRPGPPPMPTDRDRRNFTTPDRQARLNDSQSRAFLSEVLEHLFDQKSQPRWYFVIWSRDGSLWQKSDSAPDISFPDLIDEDVAEELPKQLSRTSDAAREVIYVSTFGTHVLVGKSLAADFEAHHANGMLLLLIGAGVLGVGLAGGWAMSGRAIRPIAKITAAAESISARNLSKRIDAADTDDEFGQLTCVLNQTFDRLESAFETQKRFTADASHELRTPLSVILTQIEHATARERTPSEYIAAFEACERAGRRMKALISSLLILARLDSEQPDLALNEVDLSDIASECVELLRPLAADHNITIRTDLHPALLSADRQRLTQVVTNILSNAISFSRDKGQIDVVVKTSNHSAIIAITDNGIGISEEHLPHIFERFYRVDKARNRADGGSGLGLAICQSIVHAHGGEIEARSQLNIGTTITVHLPLSTPE